MESVSRRIPPIEMLIRWADLEGRPRIILDEDLRLVWSNAAADDHLRAGGDVRLVGDRFEIAGAAEHAAFQRFVEASGPAMTAWSTPQAGGGVIIFRAWRIDTDAADVIGLVFHPTGGDYVPRWADFGRALGLTASEQKIALRLLDGVKIETAAEDMGITTATARTHVRNLYQKLSISSREALFRLLAPFRVG